MAAATRALHLADKRRPDAKTIHSPSASTHQQRADPAMTKQLRTALTRYPHTAALMDGDVTPTSVTLDFVALTSIFPAFRKMARGLEYDVSEFGISTAIQAKSLGVGFTPLPIFVTRRFDYDELYFDVRSGISAPADLANKRIALRSYTVTDAVWAKGLLADRFGLDSDQVTFVVTGDEHLAQAELPSNCELLPDADPSELITTGQVAAILGRFDGTDPNIQRLIPDPKRLATEWLEATGFTPVHHTIVVRDELLLAYPELATDLFAAFTAAKAPMLERFAAGGDLIAEDESPTGPLHDFGTTSTAELVRPDPMPYGLASNRLVLEPLLRYCYDQHLIDTPLSPEEVFAPVDKEQ